MCPLVVCAKESCEHSLRHTALDCSLDDTERLNNVSHCHVHASRIFPLCIHTHTPGLVAQDDHCCYLVAATDMRFNLQPRSLSICLLFFKFWTRRLQRVTSVCIYICKSSAVSAATEAVPVGGRQQKRTTAHGAGLDGSLPPSIISIP